MNKMLAMKLDI